MSPPSAPATPRSVQFRRERERSWRELEALVERVEHSGPGRLGAEEAMRLPVLYRAAVSSLSVARAISLDRSLIDYLDALASRAYLCVYGPSESTGRPLLAFFHRDFPRAVRSLRWSLLLAAALMLAGTLTGYLMTQRDPGRFAAFVPEAMAQGRGPFASTEDLRAVLYGGEESGDEELVAFSSFLFQNNARIGLMCFAFGVLFGVPVVYFMFSTGLMLGAFAAVYARHGLGVEFWGWILPHGVTELGAAVLCGAAGLALGHAVLAPGERTHLASVVRRSREVGLVALGCVLLFLVAGLIEGIFRQRVHDEMVRYAVAAGTLLLWALYFLRAGRGGVEEHGGSGPDRAEDQEARP